MVCPLRNLYGDRDAIVWLVETLYSEDSHTRVQMQVNQKYGRYTPETSSSSWILRKMTISSVNDDETATEEYIRSERENLVVVVVVVIEVCVCVCVCVYVVCVFCVCVCMHTTLCGSGENVMEVMIFIHISLAYHDFLQLAPYIQCKLQNTRKILTL